MNGPRGRPFWGLWGNGMGAGCTGVGWPACRDQETDRPRGDAASVISTSRFPPNAVGAGRGEDGGVSSNLEDFAFQAAENSQPRATPCSIVESMRHPLSHEAPVTGPDSILGGSSDFPKGFFPSGGRAASEKTSVGPRRGWSGLAERQCTRTCGILVSGGPSNHRREWKEARAQGARRCQPRRALLTPAGCRSCLPLIHASPAPGSSSTFQPDQPGRPRKAQHSEKKKCGSCLRTESPLASGTLGERGRREKAGRGSLSRQTAWRPLHPARPGRRWPWDRGPPHAASAQTKAAPPCGARPVPTARRSPSSRL